MNFIKEKMILAPGYPSSIQIPHALAASWSFRKSYTVKDWKMVPMWHKLIGGFFCNGYGGTVLSAALFGKSINILSHETILYYFLSFGLLLVNYSPNDVIYKSLETKLHPLRILTVFGDAVDSTTTILGVYEMAKQLHPTVSLAPWVAGISTMVGGSMFRWLERKGRKGEDSNYKTEWNKPSGGLQSGMVYIVMYHYLRRWRGVRFARLWITLCNASIKVVQDVGPPLFGHPIPHPAVCIYNRVQRMFALMCKRLNLGPQCGTIDVSSVAVTEYTIKD
jgi:hypothetical protein